MQEVQGAACALPAKPWRGALSSSCLCPRTSALPSETHVHLHAWSELGIWPSVTTASPLGCVARFTPFPLSSLQPLNSPWLNDLFQVFFSSPLSFHLWFGSAHEHLCDFYDHTLSYSKHFQGTVYVPGTVLSALTHIHSCNCHKQLR